MTDEQKRPDDAELLKLLPFYVNRSLEQPELTAVEELLARSDEARQEVAFLEGLRQGIKDQPQGNSPGALGLKRLQREIARHKETSSSETNETGAQASDRARRAQENAQGGVAVWWRHLAVAACLMLAVFGSLTISGGPGSGWLGTDRGPELAGSSNGAVLQVTFQPDATEAAIRSLLLETGLSIKEGPSSLGIYQLNLEANGTGANLTSALQKLRARRDVVETAEID